MIRNTRLKTNKRLWLFSVLLFLSLFLYFLVDQDIPVDELKSKYTNASSKFMQIDGMEVHYRDEGKGMPVVLVHGTAASLHTWDGWASQLEEHYRVIRMDLPAFGLTGPNPDRKYNINRYTNFLHNFISKLEIDSLYLAGNSLGGNIAWNYAADHPYKVKKMILIDPSGYPSNQKPSFVFRIAKTPIINTIARYITPKWIIKKNLEQVYYDDQKVTEELVTRYHQMALRTGNRQAFIDRTKTNYVDNTSKLKNLSVTSLILWGANDTWIPPSYGQKFIEDLPNARLKIMEQTGHVPMEEKPYESVQIAIDFFKEIR